MLPEFLLKNIKNHVSLEKINYCLVETTQPENIQPISKKINLGCVINLEKVNNIRRINKFHEEVNNNLDYGGYYISCAETIEQRQNKFRENIYFGFKNAFLLVDFIFKRVLPKLPLTKQIYFALTRGHNRVISKAETLGRLSSCGFKILNYFDYKNKMYIIAKKNNLPLFSKNPSYGPLISLDRLGYKKNIFKIYKFRTMHPYSEFIQAEVFNENNLNERGKLYNDFRLTSWGKFLRKYWIDELPQLYNLFRGDIVLIGPRALSKHYFSLYPKELQKLRTSVRPGLIPPYYADMPKNFNEIIESEKLFLIQKKKSPIMTSIKYFFISIFNIIVKGARSS